MAAQNWHQRFLITTLLFVLTGCLRTAITVKPADPVELPLLRNSAKECYYIDDFLPTPNNVVSGRSGKFALRYYFYKKANYKDWSEKSVVLSFYSRDNRCWSLYEEYTSAN